MIRLISPTGKEPRVVDAFGSGLFRAPRGSRKHAGVDYQCTPDQDVVAPVSGTITRIARPYSQPFTKPDGKIIWYEGCEMKSPDIKIKMFYFKPDRTLIGKSVMIGQVIGQAQNIALKYNTPSKIMMPHIHLQIDEINPEAVRTIT